MDALETNRESVMPRGRSEQIALELGNAVGGAEQAVLTAGTSRVYRFRRRHPWLYGIITFMIGGGFIAVFTMTTYKNLAFEGVNLKAAMYQIIFGGLGGGIATVILAFAYAGTIGKTLPAMKLSSVIKR
jgi:hypothetical protein